ncbi:uncharacterized protein WM277_000195 isoform 1-T1 [Molossus nigricans]
MMGTLIELLANVPVTQKRVVVMITYLIVSSIHARGSLWGGTWFRGRGRTFSLPAAEVEHMTWLGQSVHAIPLGTVIGSGTAMNCKQPIRVKIKSVAGSAPTKTGVFSVDAKEEGPGAAESRQVPTRRQSSGNNTIKKWAKDLSRYLTKDAQMVNKHMKRRSTSCVLGEVQMKTTGYCYMPVTMAKTQNTDNIKLARMSGKRNSGPLQMGMQTGTATLGNSFLQS